MSSNVVWREGVESLNEDLLLVKISEHTPPPPSLTTFGFLHLCFLLPDLEGWGVVRGEKKRCLVMSHHERGEFASRSPLPPLRHPGAPQTPSLVSEHVWFGPFTVCLTLFFALPVSLYRTYRQLWSQSSFIFFSQFLQPFYLSFSLYKEHTVDFFLPLWHHDLHPCHFSLLERCLSPMDSEFLSSSFIKVSVCFSSV